MTAPARPDHLDLRAPDGTRVTFTRTDRGAVLAVGQASAAGSWSGSVALSAENAEEAARWLAAG